MIQFHTGEKYIPSQGDEWQEMAEMFNPRSNFATAVLDELIFAIGGYDGKIYSKASTTLSGNLETNFFF